MGFRRLGLLRSANCLPESWSAHPYVPCLDYLDFMTLKALSSQIWLTGCALCDVIVASAMGYYVSKYVSSQICLILEGTASTQGAILQEAQISFYGFFTQCNGIGFLDRLVAL